MSNEVISYIEMCQREGTSLQAGMNFGLGGNHSVILMSVRPNSPYRDRLEDDGSTLIYEGHDHPKIASCPNPKVVDQPLVTNTGRPTQNGKFLNAAKAAAAAKRSPERVRVYEKERVLIAALIGVAVGVFTIVLARIIRGQRWLYSIGLLVLPGLYALFALLVGEQSVGVKEMIYGVPFIVAGLVFATVSVRRSAVMVGAFWILHGLYDLAHSRLITNAGVPDGYPVFCFSVDVVVGAYLLWLSRRIPDANLRQA